MRCTLVVALASWAASMLVAGTGCGAERDGDLSSASEESALRVRRRDAGVSAPDSGVRDGGAGAVDAGAPPSQPQIAWRFQVAGSYSSVRPAVGPDGTVYAVDIASNLYALSPAGALRWQAALGSAGAKGLAVGQDGSVYAATEDTVRAYAPDGALRWVFTQTPRSFIFQALGLGPDGNLYCVSAEGMGVFSLTPGGALRWSTPERYNRPIVSYGALAFDAGGSSPQLYFYANAHTRALPLDGSSTGFIFSAAGRPVVSPFDGSVHVGDQAFSPSGAHLWASGLFIGGTPVIAPDGVTHLSAFVTNYAINPDGTLRWQTPSVDYVDPIAVDPAGAFVLYAGNDVNTVGGVIKAYSRAGALLWTLSLPQVLGSNQTPERLPAFSADGSTMYLMTNVVGVVPQLAFVTAIRLR